MKIGFNARYLRDYNLRGFNRYTVCLLKTLQAIPGMELVLFTDQRSPIHPAFLDLLKVQMVTLHSPKALFWEQVILPRALRRYGIDIFHAPADGGLPGWKSRPYVLTYHRALDVSVRHLISSGALKGRLADYAPVDDGVRGRYLALRHALLRRLYLRSADRVIAVSEYGKWELVELLGVPQDKIEVTYLAADDVFTSEVQIERVEATQARYGLPVRYLLFVGGFEPWKNVQGLIKAFTEAKKTGVKDGLVLAGIGGDRRGAQALAMDLGLQEGQDIVFLERIHEDLPALYHGATAFITLSWGESFCLPAVEAMTCGVPVIASNFGALPEILAEGGLLVDPRNPDELVRTIQAVTSQDGLRAELRAKALKRASAFSWRRTAEHTLKVYEGVLGQSLQGETLSI